MEHPRNFIVLSLKSWKLRSRAEHPRNLMQIALPRGASSKFHRFFVQNRAPMRSIRKIRSIFHYICICIYIHTYPKQGGSGLLHGGPYISLLEIYKGSGMGGCKHPKILPKSQAVSPFSLCKNLALQNANRKQCPR